MIDRKALLTDLKVQVRRLEDDLRERAGEVEEFDVRLRAEWQAARDAKRIAATYDSWLDERVTQSAVAWVLSTVFVRFCEDNELIDLPYLAGPDEQVAIAIERQQAFFEDPQNRAKTDREWIEEGFKALSDASSVAAGLFDRGHNPMWRITPSLDAAKALIAFWRRRGDDGKIMNDFRDDLWNTRFLGDLYQDLSEAARKTYALLQTPEFVEEFILDLTLDPAIEEFGLYPEPPDSPVDLPNGLRLIDPTCGSGHFLLGAFERLLTRWEEKAPGAERWDLINRVLYSVHGVDKNASAVAIARFRLMLAAMRAGSVSRLADTPDFAINLAVGDSLVHGRGAPGIQGELDLFDTGEAHTYATEDVDRYIKSVDILGVNSYHVVVGNPPYITVKDKAENEYYRKRYATCAGTYALSVPFAERFFNLARRGGGGGGRRDAGYAGQITANSFMKRGFGKKLIEIFFGGRDERRSPKLTRIIDTSGAHIPGHGTPTVILIGRNRISSAGDTVRTVMSITSEPGQPINPAQGQVWRAILAQVDNPGSESIWVNVQDIDCNRFARHPWSLSGGGAAELMSQLNSPGNKKLLTKIDPPIGRAVRLGSDDAFVRPRVTARLLRNGSRNQLLPIINGDAVRDWCVLKLDWVWYPYSGNAAKASFLKDIWAYRSLLAQRRTFQGVMEDAGREWWEYMQHTTSAYATPLSIVFSNVATHNHFSLDRGGKVFDAHAPVIKLPKETSEDDHLELLGILNSSTACFWLKQGSHDKGNRGGERSTALYSWDSFYEFTGTRLQDLPLPARLPRELAQRLDILSRKLANVDWPSATNLEPPTQEHLEAIRHEYLSLRRQMVALQEELDWEVYRLYGLISTGEAAELLCDFDSIPEVSSGERAFELYMARNKRESEAVKQWYKRHGSTPTTEAPPHWPEAYKRVVEKRIETIEKLPRTIGLIERPECKRRWASEPWEKKEKAALRNWLLDRCEERELWFAVDDMGNAQPRPMTVNRLADRLRSDADFVSVARLYAGPDAELAYVLAEIIETEHVPHLAALRYKDPTGLRKRAQWEDTWEKQREEDATGERLDIPVPPKYASADFLKTSYWRNRGKLDVPKERFISYPGSSPDGDSSLLLGWAGWDHREQAHALMTLIEERSTRDGWERDRLIPLIAGLAEVLPWVRQWHGEVDSAFGMSPADAYAGYLEDQQLRHRLSAEDLTGWRPPKRRRGRKKTTNE